MRIRDWSPDVCSADLGRPLAGTAVRIDGDGGIQLRGPTLMRGYLDDAEATARAFTDGGRLRAGDAGLTAGQGRQMGSATCRERGCQYVKTAMDTVDL